MEIRTLRANEIECRAAQVTDKGASILLYKDARCDMRILDELFTPFGWQRRHELIGGKEFCTVSIKGNDGEWISKQDCGTESNTEKEKGQSSDAFKRACFNWGIGRELYSAPFIWIDISELEIKEKNGKKALKSVPIVSDIQYSEEREIIALKLVNNHGVVLFDWKKGKASPEVKPDIICPVCGKPVKGGRMNGVTYTPSDILSQLGCCMSCYKAKTIQAEQGDT